jgi:hypothetical protein
MNSKREEEDNADINERYIMIWIDIYTLNNITNTTIISFIN